MAKVKYTDHLDDLLERFMNEDLSDKELEKLVKQAKAIVPVAKILLQAEKIKVDATVRLIEKGNLINNEQKAIENLLK